MEDLLASSEEDDLSPSPDPRGKKEEEVTRTKELEAGTGTVGQGLGQSLFLNNWSKGTHTLPRREGRTTQSHSLPTFRSFPVQPPQPVPSGT